MAGTSDMGITPFGLYRLFLNAAMRLFAAKTIGLAKSSEQILGVLSDAIQKGQLAGSAWVPKA